MTAAGLSQLAADADRCVRCGLCIPLCPTWQISGNEAESPRGRIVAMAAMAAGKVPADAAQALDSCLGCGICERACPVAVPYTRMIGPAKKLTGAKPHALSRLLVRMADMPGRNQLLATLLAAGRMAAKINLPLPRTARAAAASAPRATRSKRKRIEQPQQGPEALLFAGCFGSALDAPAQYAARRLLAAAGWRVSEPRGQACCGALAEHAGDTHAARLLAAKNMRAFPGDMPIATTASGCAQALAASGLGLRTKDACELVLERFGHLPACKSAPAGLRIVMHMPCSQQMMPASAAASEELLDKLPGAEVVAVGERCCCGTGGLTHLAHPRQGASLADRMAASMLEACGSSERNTFAFASANHSCARSIEHAFARIGLPSPVRHPLEIFAERWLDEPD